MRVRGVVFGASAAVGAVLLAGCGSSDGVPAVEGELLASKQTQQMTYGDLVGRENEDWVRGFSVCPYATEAAVKKAAGGDFDGLTDLTDLEDEQQGMVLLNRGGTVVTSYATSRTEVDFCAGSGSTRPFKASETATVVKSTDDFTNFIVK